MSSVCVRIAQQDDLFAIDRISTFYDYNNPTDFISLCIREKRVYVIVNKDVIIGYLLWQYIRGNTPFLALVQVHPRYQRKGYGKQLVESFEENVRSQKYNHYVSSTTLGNDMGQKFHEALGCKEIGTLDMQHEKEVFYIKHI